MADLAPSEAWTVRGTSHQLAYATHGVFRFFGKFPPPIAALYLLREHTREGDLVNDPMCGSGTTGVEALLSDRLGSSRRRQPPRRCWLESRPGWWISEFDAAVTRVETHYQPRSARDYPFEPVGLRDPTHWFLPATSDSLRGLRMAIEAEDSGPIQDALWVAFAGTVRRASRGTTQQGRLFLDVDTALPSTLSTFLSRAKRLRQGLSELSASSRPVVSVTETDMKLEPDLEPAPLTILHPPYFNAYRYSSVNSSSLPGLARPMPTCERERCASSSRSGRRRTPPDTSQT